MCNREWEILLFKEERVAFTGEQLRAFLGAEDVLAAVPRRGYCIMALVKHRLTFMPC